MAAESRPPTAAERRKPVLCLIGGIGSGKSHVAAELAARGGKVIAGDPIGHEALLEPDIRDEVVRRWGPGLLDEQGQVVRRRLGAVVFSDPAALRELEDLVFPYIQCRMDEMVAAARADPSVRFVVVDAAVLLEAKWDRCCDRIVYVHAPRALRYRRLQEQRGWSTKEVDARARAQLSLTDKVSRAHFVVDNSGSPEQLRRQIGDLLRQALGEEQVP